MSQNRKKWILKIFVAHKDFSGCSSLEEAYRVIQEEVGKINTHGLQKDLIEIELQDYQIDRDISNPNNPTFQSAETLEKDALKAHAVFTLVDGDISPRIEKWYKKQIQTVKSENEHQQIPMPIFWNVADAESMRKCEEFYRNDDRDFIYKYATLEGLRNIVNNLLQDYTSRWAKLISRDINVPTLESNRLKRNIRRLIYSFIFLVLAVILYLLWPRIQDMISQSPASDPTIALPSSHAADENREDINITEEDTESLQVPKPVVEPKHHVSSKPEPSQPDIRPVIKENGYRLTGIDNDVVWSTTLMNALESSSELRKYTDKEVKWNISISQDKIERGIDDGDYFVDLIVSVKITNNITGATLQQLPLFKNECIMSPISYEDAFREAFSEEFAKQIVNGIINSINDEK